MGAHDEYGKRIMEVAADTAFRNCGDSVRVDYGAGQPARIDGTVGDRIAVEIESRVSKQVRGAVMDLICHPYPKKLLVLLPVWMSDAETAAAQCRNILRRFLPSEDDFRVVVLEGSGKSDETEADALRVALALRELGHGPHA